MAELYVCELNPDNLLKELLHFVFKYSAHTQLRLCQLTQHSSSSSVELSVNTGRSSSTLTGRMLQQLAKCVQEWRNYWLFYFNHISVGICS